MSATQFFPISPEMLALVSETVSRQVSRLPFLRSGIMVTAELIAVTMECLNAEPTKSLALTTPRDAHEGVKEGLDRCLEGRLKISGKTTVPVLYEILVSAGIAEPAGILDRDLHITRKGMRLLPRWTWHIASTPPPELRENGPGDDSSSRSWMSICPVCRTGTLNRVVGKQLFGIPHTDFIIECTSCGAKFIPVGPAFRLVSVASIRDPLWKKHLDKTFPPETWAALARGTSPGGNPLRRPAETKPSGPGPAAPSRITCSTMSRLKDGSLGVPFEGKTLYFRPVILDFSGGVRDGTFSRIQKTLAELLENPSFSHLRDPVNMKYSRYLPIRTGIFLSQLRERHDPFYREFLNQYGDEKYGSFRVHETGETKKNGVMVVITKQGIYHAVSCPDSFQAAINNIFGRILADDCLLTGDATRCRINAVLSNNKKDAQVMIHSCADSAERDRITVVLNEQVSS